MLWYLFILSLAKSITTHPFLNQSKGGSQKLLDLGGGGGTANPHMVFFNRECSDFWSWKSSYISSNSFRLGISNHVPQWVFWWILNVLPEGNDIWGYSSRFEVLICLEVILISQMTGRHTVSHAWELILTECQLQQEIVLKCACVFGDHAHVFELAAADD